MKKNIVLAGVGGQGILFTTKVLAETASRKGENILVSETHGMSQRGGSVLSHLKIGRCYNPLVRRGTADLVYIFERGELAGNLSFLGEGGTCLVNGHGDEDLPKELRDALKGRDMEVSFFDGQGVGEKLGASLCANMALLGFSLSRVLLPFSRGDVEETIRTDPKFCKVNLSALSLGYQAGKE